MPRKGPIPGTTRLDDRTFAATPQVAYGWATIAGYIFIGMDYYNEDPNRPDAVTCWLTLLDDPNYEDKPPVLSGSVDIEISGTVDEPPAR